MSDDNSWIQDVWSYNLESEMKILRELVERYPYISMVSFIYYYFYINNYIYNSIMTRIQSKNKNNSIFKTENFL